MKFWLTIDWSMAAKLLILFRSIDPLSAGMHQYVYLIINIVIGLNRFFKCFKIIFLIFFKKKFAVINIPLLIFWIFNTPGSRKFSLLKLLIIIELFGIQLVLHVNCTPIWILFIQSLLGPFLSQIMLVRNENKGDGWEVEV